MIRARKKIESSVKSGPAVSELFKEMVRLDKRFVELQNEAELAGDKKSDELIRSVNSLLRQTRVFLLSTHTEEARESLHLIRQKLVDLAMLPNLSRQ